jgi:serine/threonine protein kinase
MEKAKQNIWGKHHKCWYLLLIMHLIMIATVTLSSQYISALQKMTQGHRELHRREVVEMDAESSTLPTSTSSGGTLLYGNTTSPLESRLIKDKIQCPNGYFRVIDMEQCRPWLDCNEIEREVRIVVNAAGNGLGKIFSKAEWQGRPVAFIRTREDKITSQKIVERVRQGFENLKMLQPHPRVTQLIGYCIAGNVTVMITELGAWGDLRQFMLTPTFKGLSLAKRTDLAAQLVDAIDYVHNSPSGSRINCDMNTVGQALAQFVVLDDMRIVLNDVDDLPAGDSKAKLKSQCVVGRHNVNGTADHSFEAPERRWPWPDKFPSEVDPQEFEARMRTTNDDSYSEGDLELKSPQVDEKSDIWKLPDLVEKILISGIAAESENAKRTKAMLAHLRPILRECKFKQPEKRPNARTVSNHLIRLERKLENLDW